MKKAIIVLVFLIANHGFLYCQNKVEILSDTTLIQEEYSANLEKPLVISSFKYLKNNAEVELYIFNRQSYNYFQDLRNHLEEDNGEDLTHIIERYNDIIAKNHSLYNALSKKNKEQQALYLKTIEDLEFGLENLESTVNLTQNSLLNANNTLDIATTELKDHRKKQFWENFGNVGTGAAIGLLLGVLIAN